MYINVIIEELHWPATSTRSRPRSSQRCSPPGRAAPRGPPPSPSGDSTWCPDIYISPQLTPAPSPSSSCLRSLIFLVWPSAACWLELEHLCWLGPAGGWCHHPVTELPGHSGRTTSHNPHSELRLRTIRRRRHVISMVNTPYIKDDFVLRSSLTIRYMQCVKK